MSVYEAHAMDHCVVCRVDLQDGRAEVGIRSGLIGVVALGDEHVAVCEAIDIAPEAPLRAGLVTSLGFGHVSAIALILCSVVLNCTILF